MFSPGLRIVPSRILPALLMALCLGGCASLGATGLGSIGLGSGSDTAAPVSDIATRQTLSVVTTRKAVKDGRSDPWFGSERARQPNIARVTLVSPAQAGALSLAAAGLADWGIARVERVPALSIGSRDDIQRRDVLLYVHGYNQTFATATLDAARLSDRLVFRGDTVLFSWPSRNKLLDYVSDRESAIWSRDALETTLDNLISDPHVSRVHIVAHSMGSMLTVESLRQIYAHHGDAVYDKIGAIVFASPDIDIDSFTASLARMGRMVDKMTVVTAADDRALAVATGVAGGTRVGSAEKARLQELGIKVIDASGLGSGILNHDLFLSNAKVQQVIANAVAEAKDLKRAGGEAFAPDAAPAAEPVVSAQ